MNALLLNAHKTDRLYKVALVVCLQILFTSVTFCCSCGFRPFSVRYILLPELVFEGEAICIESVFLNDSKWEYYKYTFQIHEVVNGEYDPNEIEIYTTAPYSGSCGSLFYMDEVYFIVTSKRDNRLFFTGKCAMNLLKSSLPAEYEQVFCDYLYSADITEWRDVEGKLAARGNVINQKAEGEWIFYHDDGSIESSGWFINGLKHCTWNYYLDKRLSKSLFKEMDIAERSTVKDSRHILKSSEEFDHGELWQTENHH